MAFTIRFPQTLAVDSTLDQVRRLQTTISLDGRFRFQAEGPTLSFKGLPKNSKAPRVSIALRQIRLLKKKPYCGNHPGECEVTLRKKPNATYLEWDDWVQFNNLINDWLDGDWKLKDSDVWSNPQDVNGTFWIRKDGKRRIQYDWESDWHSISGREIRIWNKGTPDQFELTGDEEYCEATSPGAGRCTMFLGHSEAFYHRYNYGSTEAAAAE